MTKNHFNYLTIRLPILAVNSLMADFVGSRKSTAAFGWLVCWVAILYGNTNKHLTRFAQSSENLLTDANMYATKSVAGSLARLLK